MAGAGQAGTGPIEKKQAKAAELRAMSYEHILEHRVAFGSGPGLVERLQRLRAEMGIDGIVVEMNPGGMLSAEQEARSLRILAGDVLPALA